MRVGIYSGRHRRGEPAWVQARSFVLGILDELRRNTSLEIVLYTHPLTIDDRLREGIELAPVLVTVATNLLYHSASRYFRKLPNGAQCRLLIRYLPGNSPNVTDPFWLSLLAWRDRLDLLHVIGQTSVPRVSCPTVLSLAPSYSPAPENNGKQGNSDIKVPPLASRSIRRADAVICAFDQDRKTIVRERGSESTVVVYSPPALDDAFRVVQRAALKEKRTLMLDGQRVAPDFLVISLPHGDRGASEQAVRFVGQLQQPPQSGIAKSENPLRIVILCDDERQERSLRRSLPNVPIVIIPRRIHRAMILAHARAVVLLHRGRDRMRAVMECLSVGVPVCCENSDRLLAALQRSATGLIIEIRLDDLTGVAAELARIVGETNEKQSPGVLQANRIAAPLPLIRENINDAIALYQRLCTKCGSFSQSS